MRMLTPPTIFYMPQLIEFEPPLSRPAKHMLTPPTIIYTVCRNRSSFEPPLSRPAKHMLTPPTIFHMRQLIEF